MKGEETKSGNGVKKGEKGEKEESGKGVEKGETGRLTNQPDRQGKNRQLKNSSKQTGYS